MHKIESPNIAEVTSDNTKSPALFRLMCTAQEVESSKSIPGSEIGPELDNVKT